MCWTLQLVPFFESHSTNPVNCHPPDLLECAPTRVVSCRKSHPTKRLPSKHIKGVRVCTRFPSAQLCDPATTQNPLFWLSFLCLQFHRLDPAVLRGLLRQAATSNATVRLDVYFNWGWFWLCLRTRMLTPSRYRFPSYGDGDDDDDDDVGRCSPARMTEDDSHTPSCRGCWLERMAHFIILWIHFSSPQEVRPMGLDEHGKQ